MCVCSSADGHLGGFHSLAVVHHAAMNMRAQASLWMCVCIPPGHTLGWNCWVTWSLYLTAWEAVGPPSAVASPFNSSWSRV